MDHEPLLVGKARVERTPVAFVIRLEWADARKIEYRGPYAEHVDAMNAALEIMRTTRWLLSSPVVGSMRVVEPRPNRERRTET